MKKPLHPIVTISGLLLFPTVTSCAQTHEKLSNPPAPYPISETGETQETGLTQETGETQEPEELSPEEELFMTACAGCHGEDGDSGSAPNLSIMVPLMPDEQLENVIVNGSGPMPGGTVPTEDVPSLITYLRNRFP